MSNASSKRGTFLLKKNVIGLKRIKICNEGKKLRIFLSGPSTKVVYSVIFGVKLVKKILKT